MFYKSVINTIGNTPLVKINNCLSKNGAQVFIKLEEFNIGGSIKSRVGLRMIEDAENSKLIKKGDTLIEPTGGNTGIGLAIGAAIKGYKLILTIPDHFSQEKMKTLERYNAQIVLADHKRGNDCHIQKAIEIRNEHPEYICLNQFANLSNPKSHYYGTGQEIINTMQNKIDYFIASIGSGGTIMGVGKKLKENIANVQVIGVQPKGCDMKNNIYIAHKIQATAVGKVGTFVDFSIIDEMIDVDFEEVQQIREYMSKEQGLFVGISSGANILAAFKKACTLDKDKVIVTIAPDSGRSYLDIR